MRPSVIHDEKTYKQVIQDMALGIPQSTIARALGVNENTVSRWKKRKDFRRDLALAEMEMSRDPIEKVKSNQPLAWLERKFRDEWAPPKNQVEGAISISYSGWDEKDRSAT